MNIWLLKVDPKYFEAAWLMGIVSEQDDDVIVEFACRIIPVNRKEVWSYVLSSLIPFSNTNTIILPKTAILLRTNNIKREYLDSYKEQFETTGMIH